MHHRHFKLFKPYGYLSQFQTNAKHEINKKFLGALYDFPQGYYGYWSFGQRF